MSFLYKHINVSPQLTPVDREVLTFPSPALGEAFDFSVTVRLSRSPNGRRGRWTPEPEEAGRVGDLVRRTVRAVTRRHSIFDPAAAEQAVNETLDHRLAEASRNGIANGFQWAGQAEVSLPEEVKVVRRAHLIRLQEMEAQAEAMTSRVAKLRESSAVWGQLLAEATKSPYARYAVRLAENPETAADIFESMLDAHRQDAEELLALVAKIVGAQQAAGVYDLVLASDSALRGAFERLGVPLPPADPDSLFAPLDEMS